MSYDKNVYYHPEKSGLTIVDEIDTAGSYSFDLHVVWVDDRGRFYFESDSGCSCPTPFEDYDLSNMEPLTNAQVRARIAALTPREYASDRERVEFVKLKADMIATVMKAGRR